jgi:STE24 endopeptidase
MSEMTATRMAGRVATITGVIALWLVAAGFLWQTHVPSGLQLPHLDPRNYFSAAELSRALGYERFQRIDWLLSVLATIAALVVVARRGPRLGREIGLGRIGTGIVLGMLAITTVWAVNLPFAVASRWWERRHGLTHGSWADWLLSPWAQLLGQEAIALLVIVVVLVLTGRFPRRWWIGVAPALTAIALLFAFVSPYVTALGTHGLRSPALRSAATSLERREGVEGTPISVQDVSRTTTQANAMSEGIGPSRRVVLWNTLLDGRFSFGEVKFVIAHELGHTARRHIWKGVAWFGLFALPGALAIAEVTRRWGGLRDPGLLPLAMLVLVVFQLATTPIVNAISRRYEAEADWIALETTRDPVAGRGLFEKFSRTSLQQPSPPRWDYVMLENHPTIMQRIAMMDAWKARNPLRAEGLRAGS